MIEKSAQIFINYWSYSKFVKHIPDLNLWQVRSLLTCHFPHINKALLSPIQPLQLFKLKEHIEINLFILHAIECMQSEVETV